MIEQEKKIELHRSQVLYRFALEHNIIVTTMVEIGVYKGENAFLLRNLFPQTKLYLVDSWKFYPSYLHKGWAVSKKQKDYDRAQRKTQELFKSDPNTIIIPKTAVEAAPELPNNLDLVFIDANHAYEQVRENILSWLPKLRSGAMLSGHNYHPSRFPGVKQAVDEIFGSDIFLGDDQVWIKIV